MMLERRAEFGKTAFRLLTGDHGILSTAKKLAGVTIIGLLDSVATTDCTLIS